MTEPRLPFYAAGSLGSAEAAEVEAHLAQCESCRQELAEWRDLSAAVKARLAARSPAPADLGAVVALHLAEASKQPGRGFSRRIRGLLLLTGLLLVAIGMWQSRHGTTSQIDTSEAQSSLGSSDPLGEGAGGGISTAADAAAGVDAPVPREGGASGPLTSTSPDASTSGSTSADLTDGANGPTMQADESSAGAPSATSSVPGQNGASTPLSGPSMEDGEDSSAQVRPGDGSRALPSGHGTIAGTVVGADGQPRAEVVIVAHPYRSSGPRIETYTGPDGRYVLEVPAGTYVIGLEGPVFKPAWYRGELSRENAHPVSLVPGGRVDGIDFVAVSESGPSGPPPTQGDETP